jgi:hypothetical protein
MRLVRILTLVTLSLFVAGSALALDINKDFWNTTGQVANDCEIIIEGFQTLSCRYDGDTGMEFPNFELTYETIGSQPRTILRWSGLTVPSGAKVHLGFCTEAGVLLGMRWTLDGVPIGPVTQVDVQPTLTGVGLVATNSLTLSLWPIEWPILPPPVYIGDVTAYYFATALPIGSLNNTMLPLWTPLAVSPVRVGWAPPLALGPNVGTTFTAPLPPPGAVSVVWVMDANTSAAPAQASRDFVQFPIPDPVPAAGETWGRIKTLYR